jgi:hypothetical protein
MTGKERNILDEIREDVKALLSFMATYTEKAKHCETRLCTLERSAKWTRGKIGLILGFGAGLGFAAGIAVKLVK